MTPEISSLIQFAGSILLGGIGGLLVFWGKLAKYQEKVDSLERQVDALNDRLRSSEIKVTACETRLEEREPIRKYVSKKSPLSLTEQGFKLLEESGGKEVVDTNKDELLGKIKESNPTSPYDVQEKAKDVISSLKDDPRFISIKNFTFNKGMELDIPITVMGIYLRDLALPVYGWKIEDIEEKK